MPYEPSVYNQERQQERNHEMKLINRKRLEITGVKDVDSFDTEEFLLQTTLGYLLIRGENLHMKNLDVEQGLLTIQGKIGTFSYIDDHQGHKGKGFLNKLFK
ncbi:sporulation protein YabP [Tenuibacillus multivorans]|uniref:Sporulation protein YabP n=1 Tax=Tenuibacillus multivorans TaxID=237069 RepID=A0A1G9VZU3_9BACI|nr:sporulation protein YabP [Tenuibacillus multivorans]GEL78251.1 sporulation protein YabP [Tenuibacillus multivorans]SDM77416.1 sporulation protein YabP [Tenuibacillus multivorans]